MTDRDIDQQLVERVQRGDKGAFDLLVSKYQRKIFRLLSRLVRDSAEVEDVAQEAFIKAYRALPNFRGESAFYTWLYRIAINTAKNYLVSQGRRVPTTTELPPTLALTPFPGCASNPSPCPGAHPGTAPRTTTGPWGRCSS